MFGAKFLTSFTPAQVDALHVSLPANCDVVALNVVQRSGQEEFVYLVFDGSHHPAVYTTIEEMVADNYGQER